MSWSPQPESCLAPAETGQPSAGDLLNLLLPIFRRFRARLLGGFLALLAVDLLQLTIPRHLKTGVDELAQGRASSRRLAALAAYIFLTAAVTALLRYIWRILLIGFSRHLENALRDRLFTHVLNMDQDFFDRRSVGDIMAHAANDLGAVQMAFGLGLAAGADSLVMTGAALLFMLQISPRLTLTAAAPLPLLAAAIWFLSRALHRRFERVQEQFSLLTESARRTLVSIRLIKGCTREQQRISEFDRLGQEYAALNVRAAVLQGLLLPVSGLLGSGGTALALYAGGRMVAAQAISLGDFVAFTVYLAMLVWPLTAAGWVTAMARRGLTSLARICHLLTEESRLARSLQEPLQPTAILQSCPHISLRQFSFFYPSTAVPALSGISLEIGPGVLGITGRTGSGKSTLCRLLVRQYPVADQTFFFAGHDVNQLDPALIRQRISYVGPNPALFSGTAAENIRLARPNASPDEIKAAATLAGIDEEIAAMPDGYQTRIGERGLRLSGGQKQRIAIARALIADRPILILDDALSALDAETGQRVFAAIAARQQGRTLILVSSRLRFLVQADHILLLDQGRIADQGSHARLLARNSPYQSLLCTEETDAQLRLC